MTLPRAKRGALTTHEHLRETFALAAHGVKALTPKSRHITLRTHRPRCDADLVERGLVEELPTEKRQRHCNTLTACCTRSRNWIPRLNVQPTLPCGGVCLHLPQMRGIKRRDHHPLARSTSRPPNLFDEERCWWNLQLDIEEEW